MEKKIVSVILAVAALAALLYIKDDMLIQKQTANYYDTAAAYAPCALLRDMDTGETIYQKNADMRISVGSINKVLSICIAMEHLDWDETFTVGDEVESGFLADDASRCMIRKGQVISFRHLMLGALLPSGCDAVNTIAVNVVRKIKKDPAMEPGKALSLFACMMNTYARSLGCTSSHFVNVDGQDDDRQYTCVNDVLLFVTKAMENETFLEIVKTPYADVRLASGEKYAWRNTNQLLHADSSFYYPPAIGVKTGYTLMAGHGLVACARQNGHTLLAIACGCAHAVYRYETAANLFKLGFMNYYHNR